MTEAEWKKFVAKQVMLAKRDEGRLKLLKSYKGLTTAPSDYSDVVEEYLSALMGVHLYDMYMLDNPEQQSIQVEWLIEWAERRKVLLKRIAAYEKKFGIDRKTYNIRGDLVGGDYFSRSNSKRSDR